MGKKVISAGHICLDITPVFDSGRKFDKVSQILEPGKLIHVDCAYLGELGEHIGAHHGFKVDRSKTVFYGTCGACLEK